MHPFPQHVPPPQIHAPLHSHPHLKAKSKTRSHTHPHKRGHAFAPTLTLHPSPSRPPPTFSMTPMRSSTNINTHHSFHSLDPSPFPMTVPQHPTSSWHHNPALTFGMAKRGQGFILSSLASHSFYKLCHVWCAFTQRDSTLLPSSSPLLTHAIILSFPNPLP
ncbi:hypothetical protein PIB30_111044 [Stylosanthes scabra]|uniref:Uncharacterized protein n=1 Tax=Stylosanthes scabra TaxID=79078 RepID=A0ABU6WZX8_9FABA|nr:hypothetical protein [Stylosanthes scabra]